MVARQIDALNAWDPRVAALYRQLGAVAVELARTQDNADPQALAAIERKLAARDE